MSLSYSYQHAAAMLFTLPKISPPPPPNHHHHPFSALDMAQTVEGAYFRICAICLEYISPPTTYNRYLYFLELFAIYVALT